MISSADDINDSINHAPLIDNLQTPKQSKLAANDSGLRSLKRELSSFDDFRAVKKAITDGWQELEEDHSIQTQIPLPTVMPTTNDDDEFDSDLLNFINKNQL